ncbi:MAG: NAD-binding protein [Eggerthellaceae bacterium]|nr:NAD-binding protein [Eggerthellaceae bacterium]
MYIVISGGGKVGTYLASVLLQSRNEVAVIEQDPERALNLSIDLAGNRRLLVINGDGCDSRYQEDAGIRHADVFVATTGQDDSNLVSCEIAKRVFNVQRCIARVNNPKNLRVFRKTGIECVSSTTLIASLIEDEALMGSVNVSSSLMHGNVSLNEVIVPRMRHHSAASGVAVDEIALPAGALIAAVVTKDGVEVVSSETLLFPGDTAIVVAENDLMPEVRTIFREL